MAVDQNDIDHGVELRGVYDGICYWVMKDGSYVNRFNKETRPRQWQQVEDYLSKIAGSGRAPAGDV
jgi:hypothetical protein